MNYLNSEPDIDKLFIAKEIALGLQYLHSQRCDSTLISLSDISTDHDPSIVHGDLKPVRDTMLAFVLQI